MKEHPQIGVHLQTKDNDPETYKPTPKIWIVHLTWLALRDQKAGHNSVQGRAKTQIFVTS